MNNKYSLIWLCIPLTSQASMGITSGLNKILPNGVKKWIPGLSPEEKTAQLMEEQVDTSKNFLNQMVDAAQSMKTLKQSIEQANSIKNDGKSLCKDLYDAKYGKVALGISEKITSISLNPSDYIPTLDCTREIKRECSFSYFREKALLGRIDSFTARSSNFIGTKPPKSLNGLCYDIQKELRRSDQIKVASKECNNKLIPIYKAQIKNLESQNRQIDQTLADPRFSKDDPLKFFQLESLKNKNIMAMTKLIERINKIQTQSKSLSKEDKEVISELYSEKLRKDLTQHIIKKKLERNSKF